MLNINARNVNHALPAALVAIRNSGIPVAPRGMKTLEIDGPVTTTYAYPDEMVLFNPVRDANPFFHFFEALWILRGRDDVAFLAHFLPRMAEFSDDGKRFHAPYGYRLRNAGTGIDQIEKCIELLKADPDTRQAVMSIWSPMLDNPDIKTKDKPCNDMIMLKIREGKLRMSVCNRSNDVIWGAYGANVVQFSTLLKYMAGRIGVGIGTYTQFSDSFHIYDDNQFWNTWLDTYRYGVPPVLDPYSEGLDVRDSKYMHINDLSSGAFDADLKTFFELWDKLPKNKKEAPDLWRAENYQTDSFVEVVLPMYLAHHWWKLKNTEAALANVRAVKAPDWRLAGIEWMERRLAKQNE